MENLSIEIHRGGGAITIPSSRRGVVRNALHRPPPLGAHIVARHPPGVAVNNISFTLAPGEIVGLVGESGCGKTLSCLALAGLLPPAARLAGGSITFAGHAVHLLPEKELRALRGRALSMIFQEPAASLNPLLKVQDQIAETLLVHGLADKRAARDKARALLERLGIADAPRVMRSYPHQLSGGLCQRVMIALAVIASPRLLIADEPTAALDTESGAHLIRTLQSINIDDRMAILFVSHDLRMVRGFCSRVLVMYAGRIVEDAPAADLFARPLHEYTNGLLAALPGAGGRGALPAGIPGRAPSLEEGYPPGCPFAPRCPRALPACAAAFPPARRFGPRLTHCLRAGAPS